MVYRVQDNINQVQTNLPPHILATKGGIITRAGVLFRAVEVVVVATQILKTAITTCKVLMSPVTLMRSAHVAYRTC